MKYAMRDKRCLRATKPYARQSGAVLVFGLILLLVLTLIGVSTMQGSVFDEKMAGNTKDRNFAFQSAESALRDGELWLRESAEEPLVSASGTYGVWQTNILGSGNWWEDGGGPWSTGAPAVVTSSGISNVEGQPQRITEYYKRVPDSIIVGSPDALIGKSYYRVTVKASGGTDKAVVQLQSIYSRRY